MKRTLLSSLSLEIAGPLVVGKAVVTWITLTPEQVDAQTRFGFTADNIKVRARFATRFADHALPLPQIFIFTVNNDIRLETDLTFVRAR